MGILALVAVSGAGSFCLSGAAQRNLAEMAKKPGSSSHEKV